jgi:hypothetical protein
MQKLTKQAVEQMQKLPDTIAAAWGRLVGSPAGASAMAEYNEARAEQAALNETLTQRGCASIETAAIKQ